MRGFQVFLLANVADHGDHIATIILAQPGNDDGSIQAAGISEYNFFLVFGLAVSLCDLSLVIKHDIK